MLLQVQELAPELCTASFEELRSRMAVDEIRATETKCAFEPAVVVDACGCMWRAACVSADWCV